MIYKYDDFLLLETYSEVNKQYTEEILKIFNNDEKFKTINLNHIRLPLKNLSIMFFENKNKKSITKSEGSYLNNNILNNVILKFYFPNNISQLEIKEEISHEIGHIQEIYDKLIRKKEHPENDYKESNHIIINKKLRDIRDKNKDFFVFCDIIYNTTSDELNQKVTSLYHYLKSFDIKDKKFLYNKYKISDIGKNIEEIKNIDFSLLHNKIQSNILKDDNVENKKLLFDLINEFNDKYNKSDIKHIYKFTKEKIDETNIDYYFNEWKKVILNNIKTFEKLLDEQIIKVITDLHHNEDLDYYDVNYKDYLKT